MALDDWLTDAIRTAQSHGLADEDMPPEAAAYRLCQIQYEAIRGDVRAASFLRSICGRHPVPSIPQPESEPPFPTASKRRGVLSVGFVSPSLALGGAEDWIRSLCAQKIDGVEWTGVVTSDELDSQWRLPDVPVASGDTAAAELASRSDFLLVWGIHRPDWTLLRGVENVGLVSVSHGSGEWTERLMEGVGQWAIGRIGVSEAACQSYGPMGGEVVHNGVDPQRVRPLRSRNKIRDALGIDHDERVICYYGRLSPEKDALSVPRAARALGDGWRPLLVGDGWKAAEIRTEARRIDPRTVIVERVPRPGYVFPAADCYMLTSPSEGFSLSMIEAWQAGLPVVSTPVGAVPELERRHGILTHRVPTGAKAADLAYAVRSALSPEAAAITRYAKGVALTQYTAEAMAGRVVAYLRRLWRRIMERPPEPIRLA